MEKKTIQEIVSEMSESLSAVLEWSKTHPGCTLRELEKKTQGVISHLRARLLEEAVAQQGAGKLEEERCSCGGEWVFQGYRERQVMTTQGVIRVRRAYFTCEQCGAGFFPPGPAIRDDGGVE